MVTLASFVSPSIFLYILVPLGLVQLVAFLFIPSILAAPKKPRSIAEAIFCCLMQGFGVFLMTIGSLPTVYSVLAGDSYASGVYFGLLLVFAAGGCIFLWSDHRIVSIDPEARAVPCAIVLISFRIIGQILLALAVVSIVLSVTTGSQTTGWWLMPVLMGLYGGLIAWCTKSPSLSSFTVTASRPLKIVQNRLAVAGKRKR